MLPFSSIFSLWSEANRTEYHFPETYSEEGKGLGKRAAEGLPHGHFCTLTWARAHNGDVLMELELWSMDTTSVVFITISPMGWRSPNTVFECGTIATHLFCFIC